jgi:hypothetical protein
MKFASFWLGYDSRSFKMFAVFDVNIFFQHLPNYLPERFTCCFAFGSIIYYFNIYDIRHLDRCVSLQVQSSFNRYCSLMYVLPCTPHDDSFTPSTLYTYNVSTFHSSNCKISLPFLAVKACYWSKR